MYNYNKNDGEKGVAQFPYDGGYESKDVTLMDVTHLALEKANVCL